MKWSGESKFIRTPINNLVDVTGFISCIGALGAIYVYWSTKAIALFWGV
jgi:hypothetical protein